jgi:MinD-like ATPase involved in chromosome partitioning or flagellar assembly
MLRVSFYSYKGGAGRSTTAWNTIQRMVNLMKPTAKEPFVIVDTDTESAGSTFLYKAEDVFFKDAQNQSIQRRMTDSEDTNYTEASDSEKEKFFKGMYPVGTFFGLPEAEQKAVLLIGANLNRNSAKDADVSGDGGDDSEQMQNFHNNITMACKACGAKALFFDTPSGTQFLARKSVQESEIIVCCMRPTSQFKEGTRRQLINFIKTDIEKNKAGKRKYILTPTVVCVDSGQKFVLGGEERIYPEKAKAEIKIEFGTGNMREDDEVKQAFKDNVLLDMLEPTPAGTKKYSESEDNDSVFGIPEIKRFKWFEACLGKIPEEELSQNDKMAVNRYEYLAQTILKYRKA